MPTQHPKNSNFAIFVLLGLALSLAMLFFGISCKNSDTSAPPENKPAQHSVNSSGIKPEEGNLMYEENPHPGFEDYVHQADYAISQTMQRLFMPAANLRVVAATLNEHGGHAYQQKSIVVYGVKDAPQFVQALRDSLLAWAERATLVKLSDQEAAEYFFDFYKVAAQGSAKLPEGADQSTFCWKIVLDGAVTHTLFITSAAYTEKTPVSGPRMVIIIDDIGESKTHARRLMALNFPVTFAIWPYSTHRLVIAQMAHENGTEILIHQPMEPEGYPKVNPGEGVLLTSMSSEQMRNVLQENINRVPYAVGMNNHMGSRLTQNAAAMNIVSAFLKERGFYMLDSLTHGKSRFAATAINAGGPAYRRDVFLDVEANKDYVINQLRKAERMALVKGQAIAIGHPLKATLEALDEWQTLRNTEVTLVRLQDLTPLSVTSNTRP